MPSLTRDRIAAGMLPAVVIAMLAASAFGQSSVGNTGRVREVNVPGKPMTWFGSADIDEVGRVIDHLTITAEDPFNTFAAHNGTQIGGKVSFALKTPKAGRYIFVYRAMLNKDKAINARYRHGEKWVELPQGRIHPDYFQNWDPRIFCHWIDIPQGQIETTFELTLTIIGKLTGPVGDPYSPPGIHLALVAEPRVDPFEGMPGGDHPMFEIPKVEDFLQDKLGKAVLSAITEKYGKVQPLTDEAYRRQIASLKEYEKIPASHINCQRLAWSIAEDGLMYQWTADARYAQLAGAKGARMAKWPTWGYAYEWHVDPNQVAGGRKRKTRRQTAKDHQLETSIIVQAMAIGYDLACDGMHESDRIAFREALHKFANRMYIRALDGWRFFGSSNWTGHLQASMGLAGLALLGEDRYAEQWLERFKVGLPIYISRNLDPHGVHKETLGYNCFGINPVILTAMALERRGGESIFELAGGRVEKFLSTILHMTSPDGKATRDFGDTGKVFQTSISEGMHGRAAAALLAMTRGPRADLARWALWRGAARGRGGTRINYSQNARVPNILFFRPGPQKSITEYEDFPLGWHARSPIDYPYDTGYVVMRTGFDSADDIKMVFKCGNAMGGHGHPCQGSFVLEAYGDLLSQSPGYGPVGRVTRANNLITIDAKGQAEGHHLVNGRLSNDGHVERFVHSPVADLVVANNKPAYDGGDNPVRRSLRYVLFVRNPKRQGYFVIVDDMDKDGAEHAYTWHFHTTANHRIEPDGQEGFIVRAMSKQQASELWKKRQESQMAKALQGTRRLAARWPDAARSADLRLAMVHPRKFTHRVSYKVQARRRKINIPDHLQVTQKAAEALFFTVLYPQRADRGIKMPPLKRISETDLWGVVLGADTILFSRRDGMWTYGDIETDGRLVYVRRDEAGAVTGFAVGEATKLTVAGQKLLESKLKVTAAGPELVVDDGGEWRATSAQRGMPE